MLKIIIIYVIILIGLAICGKKEDSKSKNIFLYAHIFGGILFTVVGVFHGFSHFGSAPFRMQLTGCAMLILFFTQLILGALVYKRKRRNLKKVHRFLAILILCLLVSHLILLKLF